MKKLRICFIAVYLLLLAGIGVWTLAGEDRVFSENENRMLRTKANVSDSIADGAFQADLETLLADQFPLRDRAVALQAEIRMALGEREIGGAYLGSGNRLLQKITDTDVDYEAIAKDAKKYARLCADTGIPVTLIPVPSAVCSLPKALPDGAPAYDLDRVYAILQACDDAGVLDLREALRGDGSLYYRTDHHWTTRGAFAAYRLWCEMHGKTVPDWDSLLPETVTRDFRGSLYSKAPLPGIAPEPMELIAVPEHLTVTADGTEIDFYVREALNTKDKYNVFLSGNHGLVVIENPDAAGGTLLLIKDSFANSLVPFLVRDYARIVMVDERFAPIRLRDLAEQEQPDEIAVIKEACNF